MRRFNNFLITDCIGSSTQTNSCSDGASHQLFTKMDPPPRPTAPPPPPTNSAGGPGLGHSPNTLDAGIKPTAEVVIVHIWNQSRL